MIPPRLPTSPKEPLRPFRNKIHYSSKEHITKPSTITLDWRAYFVTFCQAHGEPIEYGNVLLFRDGWRYAMAYEGPEYSPPVEHRELDILVMSYWLGRLRYCNSMLSRVLSEKDRLLGLKGAHSLDLQQTVFVTLGAGNVSDRRKGAMPLDMRPLDERISWLREDVKECEEHLAEIEKYHKESRDARTAKA